jgi:protein involved in sex pheromone biosynthesis
MKRLSIFFMATLILLTACTPNFGKQEEVVQENNNNKDEKAIIPKYKISDSFYSTLLPFKASDSRGLVVDRLNTRLDSDEFEEGLLRIAQNEFSTEEYVFQDGAYLDRETISKWLQRKYTKDQLKELGKTEDENVGLNPMLDTNQKDLHKAHEESPIYLAHILEHNYLIKENDNKVKLGGVVIGLALNSVHYYQTEQFGPEFNNKIDHKKIEAEGKKIAQEVVKRLRQMEGLKEVPIVVGLFKQESKNSIVPGNFFAYSTVKKGSSSLGDWKKIEEKYYVFPSTQAEEDHREDVAAFTYFKQDIEDYFPNYSGVVGKAFYIGKELQKLEIDITIQFKGKAETIGFAQYVTGLIMKYFPKHWVIEVKVGSISGQEALIIRTPNQDQPFVHIY